MTSGPHQIPSARQRAATAIQGGIEILVLALVCISPWLLGSVEPGTEACLFAVVALLLVLWAVQALVAGTFVWKHCPVSLGLAGLFLFGVFQLIPWPAPWLAWLSPNTVHLLQPLLPTKPELLPGGEAVAAVPLPAGAALSVHPAETRLAILRLLAVFVLFTVVRQNLGSVASLRRLSLAAFVNGFLLALFAVVQFFSSKPNTIFWSIPIINNPFGPFICKNHFPFYLNLCIGLGTGVLFSLWPAEDEAERRGRQALFNVQGLLNSPGALWCAAALAFMIGSVALSLSRGGLFSLVGTAIVCLLLRFLQTRRVSRLETCLLIGLAALAVVAWFGLEPIKARLATVWQSNTLEEGRLPLWWDLLAVVKRFPLWGTGYGTLLPVELTYRTRLAPFSQSWENAHNDYLEALVEGGVVRLAVSVTIIALVYRRCWRAWQQWSGHAAQALIGGGLFAFTTVVLHSFVDFGLHIPAITILATVVAAHLAALGAPKEEETVESAAETRLGGLVPLAAVGLALLLGWIFCREGWRLAQAYNLEAAAAVSDGEQRLALLDAASQTAPENAHLHLVAGQAYLDAYTAHLDEPNAAGLPERPPGERERLARRYLTPSLQHYVQARDLCPLIAKSHVQIAAHVEGLAQADAPSAYLRRAKEACPCHPEVWYLAGILELADGDETQAAASWRRSLELSPDYLQAILERSRTRFADSALVEQVLPARADTLLDAATYLYPKTEAEQRRPFLQRARGLLESQDGTPDASRLHSLARTDDELGDAQAALTAYEAALRLKPRQTTWRFEYAALLFQQRKWNDARRELRIVLGQQPEHAAAKRLLVQVAVELAEGN